MMATGRFITLEGTEGAGKTTGLRLVQTLLEDAGQDLLVTREPGGTALGEALRELLLSHRHTGMSADAELLLICAARAEHLATLIRPALARGQWVLCDRFSDATLAYQGGGRGIADRRIELLSEWVQQDLVPDLTLWLDLPVELGLQRAGRRSAPDRFERERQDFFVRVREKYAQLAMAQPQRIKRIDAAADLASVQTQITRVVNAFLEVGAS